MDPLGTKLAKLVVVVIGCGVLGGVLAHDEELARVKRHYGYLSQRLTALEMERMRREHPDLFQQTPDQGGPRP